MKIRKYRGDIRRNFAFAMAVGTSAVAFNSPPARAQSSVTLWGIVDAGVQYLTHADGQHSAVNLQNYGVMPSQIGLKGTEDLGGGLQAEFHLEQGINVNDGTSTVPGYAFFRGAWVGLSGSFGKVTVGRNYSVLFDETLFYDPLFYAGYGGQGLIMPLAVNFANNSIKYKSPDYKGLTIEALAATGGVAGNSRSGRILELGAQFASGRFSVSGTLHQSYGTVSPTDDTSGLHRTVGTLATHISLENATLYAGVERVAGSLDPQKTLVWGGTRYQFNPFLDLAAGVYHTMSNLPSVGHPTLFATSTTYALSKRTVGYVNLGYSLNSSHSSQPVYEYDATPLNGASQFGAMVGIFHMF
ncbi:porin [Burkholderia ubonensis]|uniref:porin n=1 Tax=Burkholderia ubonensis TaxID=101571 RepID=UPI000B24001E